MHRRMLKCGEVGGVLHNDDRNLFGEFILTYLTPLLYTVFIMRVMQFVMQCIEHLYLGSCTMQNDYWSSLSFFGERVQLENYICSPPSPEETGRRISHKYINQLCDSDVQNENKFGRHVGQ